MKSDNSGLLIAALVAIVAVVGLVILFKGGAQGAAVCPGGQDLQQLENPGGQAYYACVAHNPARYIPQSAGAPKDYQEPYDSFFTIEDNKERRYAIAQRTWEY